MMLALGLFIFSMHTVAYQEFQRSMQWRHPGNSRVGARPAYQYIGPGEETISLSGWIATELAGSPLSLTVLEQMANTGKAYTLIGGMGVVHGVFVIEQMTENKTIFFSNGAPRRIDFSISLKRIDDSLVDKLLGDLKIPDIGSML
jgi:phage protein U